MRLNRHVPVGTHGGVRGRLSDYEGLLLDFRGYFANAGSLLGFTASFVEPPRIQTAQRG